MAVHASLSTIDTIVADLLIVELIETEDQERIVIAQSLSPSAVPIATAFGAGQGKEKVEMSVTYSKREPLLALQGKFYTSEVECALTT